MAVTGQTARRVWHAPIDAMGRVQGVDFAVMQGHRAEATRQLQVVTYVSSHRKENELANDAEADSRGRRKMAPGCSRRTAAAPRYSKSSMVLLPALVLAAAGLSTDAAPSHASQAHGTAFMQGSGALLAAVRSPLAVSRAFPSISNAGVPSVCSLGYNKLTPFQCLPTTLRGRSLARMTALFQSGEEQKGAAKWRPPPLEEFSGDVVGEGDEDDLTPSDDSEESNDDTGNFSGNAKLSASSSNSETTKDVSLSTAVVVGAGALRGEQEAYTMRDVQSMKVPRLRAMCEARGLKKNGTTCLTYIYRHVYAISI